MTTPGSRGSASTVSSRRTSQPYRPGTSSSWRGSGSTPKTDPRRVRTALRAFWGGLAYQLEGLTHEQWERAGTHPEIGRVTVRSRADRQVEHAQIHLEQLRVIRQTL